MSTPSIPNLSNFVNSRGVLILDLDFKFRSKGLEFKV